MFLRGSRQFNACSVHGSIHYSVLNKEIWYACTDLQGTSEIDTSWLEVFTIYSFGVKLPCNYYRRACLLFEIEFYNIEPWMLKKAVMALQNEGKAEYIPGVNPDESDAGVKFFS
jgi:hypothetical protein